MNTKCDYSCKNRMDSSYIKWILELLGPVILGSKPSEILNISSRDNEKDIKIRDIDNFFKNCSKLSYEIIYKEDNSIRVLFINKESLSKTLENKKCINFLKFIGYPKEYQIGTYVDTLREKLIEGDFPHEIGIFLGYPLKDVVGFMGYGNYKFNNTKYWKVYGDPKVSEKVYNNFLEDRQTMRYIISNKTLSEIRLVV
ncbi:MAG: DUF3793 family protein [Paraclostridium sp.]